MTPESLEVSKMRPSKKKDRNKEQSEETVSKMYQRHETWEKRDEK